MSRRVLFLRTNFAAAAAADAKIYRDQMFKCFPLDLPYNTTGHLHHHDWGRPLRTSSTLIVQTKQKIYSG